MRLLRLAHPYWGGLTKGLFLGIILGLLGLITPYASKLLFDNVYPARDLTLLNVVVIGVAVISITTTTMGALRGYYGQVVTGKLGSAVGLLYFNHVQHLPVAFFDVHRVGEVMSRVGDIRTALGTVSKVIQSVLVNGVFLICVPPFLIALSWKLSLIAVVTTPLTVGVTAITSRAVQRYFRLSAEAFAELSAIQVEAFTHIRTIKAMAGEHTFFASARAQTVSTIQAQLRAARVGSIVTIVNGVVRIAGTGVLTWYAWRLIIAGELTLGTYVAFTAYLGYLTGPIGQLTDLFSDFQQTAVSLTRAFEYLDILPEQDPRLAYVPPSAPTKGRGSLKLIAVNLSYGSGRPILKEISAVLEAGSITAIVGPSGAGKSSILRLLCRMSEPTSGQILYGDSPISELKIGDFRRDVAVVWQDPALFRGTIWDNLAMGTLAVSMQRVREVVALCQLDSLIDELPQRYETPVAEWGATLSGGQRQRIAIARALLRDTPILLLDEATAQVDVRMERELLTALLSWATTKIVVIVTHRVTTAAIANQICVVEAGRITASGTHETVTAASPMYRELWQAAQASDTFAVDCPTGILRARDGLPAFG